MVKHSLNKLLVLLGLLALFLTYPVAAESYSDLYIKITDATTAVQNKDQAKAKELVGEIKTDFETKENHDSKAGKKVSKALDIKGDVTEEDLTSISSALLKFEKEQNPVDLDAEKEKLETRLNLAVVGSTVITDNSFISRPSIIQFAVSFPGRS